MNNLSAQEYINQNHADKTATNIFPTEKLTGELIIQDYPNLEELELYNHELTSLTITNCPQLKEINVRNNQLTKLEITGSNQINEIIAGKNELTSLDLTNCPDLKTLMVPDNPLLTEIKNLNLSTLKEINITNTVVNLTKDYEELKKRNQSLLEGLTKVEEAVFEGKMTLNTEIIQTPKQSEEAIRRLLKKVEKEWRNYFETGSDPILEVRLKSPERKRKAKEILKWIIETQTSKDYQNLAEKWSGSPDYSAENDFDGNLDILFQLLRVRNYAQKAKHQSP